MSRRPAPRSAPAPSRRRSAAPRELSRFELYELAVQNPRVLVPLLAAIHGDSPRVLAEDFSGTAALSRHWVRTIPRSLALATDLDAEALRHARGIKRLTTRCADVLTLTPSTRNRPDIIFVGNFSIGELHERRRLVTYLKRCRARLKPGGVFVCDTYGGASAFTVGAVERWHPGPEDQPALRIRYTWQQRSADPLTGLVENALHFRVFKGAELVQDLPDAFTYHWRLRSIAELRDAMREAGFSSTAVYRDLPDAMDSDGGAHVLPLTDADELDASYIVCVAARV